MSIGKGTKTSYDVGVGAEKTACDFLIAKGYKILFQRYKTKFGEIDIIAQKNKVICFVEVKIRKTAHEALESVTPRSQKRIQNTALFFLSQYPQYEFFDLRFDVIVMTSPFDILHLDNAWEASS